MFKQFSTVKLIEIDGEVRKFHDIRHAHNIEQAQLMCNEEYQEKVVGEIVKVVPFDESEKEAHH